MITEIEVSGQRFIPRYSEPDQRTKNREIVSYYNNGAVKSIYLEGIQKVNTPLGMLDAEMITFYEDGSVCRVFPLYGQISGFWTEEQERELIPDAEITVGENIIKGKVSNYCFYQTGALKSLTMWPGEIFAIKWQEKMITGHWGIRFYETGEIASIEPALPTSILVGSMTFLAFDPQAVGISGDNNSLKFYQNGEVQELISVTTGIKAVDTDGTCIEVDPVLIPSAFDVEKEVLSPLHYYFKPEAVRVMDGEGKVHDFPYAEYEITTHTLQVNLKECGDCSTCKGCMN